MLYIYIYTHTYTHTHIYIYTHIFCNGMFFVIYCSVMSFNYQNHACVAGGRVVAAVVALVAGGSVGLVV